METTTDAPKIANSTFRLISVDQVVPSHHQARKAFDEESIKGLADSMRQEGLLEPVIVRKVTSYELRVSSSNPQPETRNSKLTFELISGERRLRAAKLLGWKEIEAKIIETVSEGEAAAKGLVENIQREDLNPIEEAEAFLELNQLDPEFWNQPKIGELVGKGKDYVSRSLGLLELPDPILEELRRRNLERGHGIELLRLRNAKSQKRLAVKVAKKGWSVMQTRAAIDKLLGKSKPAIQGIPVSRHAENPIDPVAESWEEIKAKTKGWAWSAEYPGDLAWQFSINLTLMHPDNPKKALGQWFLVMAEAFGETQLDHKTEKMVDVTNAVSAAYSDIMRKIQDGSMEKEMADCKNKK